jgi:large subunit ribosomal protein L10
MAKTKAQKQEALDGLKQKITDMKAAVFVNFSGIPVKEIDALRSNCRDENIEYTVAKKTLLKKALSESGLEGVDGQDFDGEIATIMGFSDEITSARLISEFAKKHESMKVVGGVLEGSFIDSSKVDALAKLPSKDELLAKAVGSIAAPLSSMVNVLQGNLRNFVYALNAIKENKS